MIHFTKEGRRKKVGLNLYRTRGGFVVAWVWYYPETHELKGWRFRLRMHMKPRILWSVDSCNVIANYSTIHDLQLVNREVLVDLVASNNEGRMTKEEIIEMVMQIGGCDRPEDDSPALKMFVTFAKLVAEAEREACAKIVEESSLPDTYSEACLLDIANEIRARGQE